MRRTTRRQITPVALTSLALLSAVSHGADEIVESVSAPTFQYDGSVTNQMVTFTTGETITGFALTGDWSAIGGDLGGGSYPWALEMEGVVTAPTSDQAIWPSPFTGEVSIADFSIADGSGAIFSEGVASGTFTFGWFDTNNGPATLAQVENPVYHATKTVPDVTTSYTATPDAMTAWNRPFSFAGVSGLGPTRYHAFEFTVETPGVYDFLSVLSTGGNHFTILYADNFDDTMPLEDLLDYGLGNGFSSFGFPQGESGFSAVLLPGVTYTWVTSTWASFSPLADSANTIVGPDVVTEVPLFCPSDFDQDGDVDLGDFGVFGAAFGSMVGDANYDADADLDNDGDVDLGDFGIFGSEFGSAACTP